MTNEELKNQIPIEILPDYLGGIVKINHRNWLIECNKLVTNKASTCSFYYFSSKNCDSNSNCKENQNQKQMMPNKIETCKQTQDDELNSNRKRQSSDFIDQELEKKMQKNKSLLALLYMKMKII